MGVGDTVGNVGYFPREVRVYREWLGALKWAGEAVILIHVGSRFRRRVCRPAGGERVNVN